MNLWSLWNCRLFKDHLRNTSKKDLLLITYSHLSNNSKKERIFCLLLNSNSFLFLFFGTFLFMQIRFLAKWVKVQLISDHYFFSYFWINYIFQLSMYKKPTNCRHFWPSFGMLGPREAGICCHKGDKEQVQIQRGGHDRDWCIKSPFGKQRLSITVCSPSLSFLFLF